MRSWAVLAVVVAVAGAVGCDGSEGEESSRDASVLVAVVREVLHGQPPPADPEVLPVVYVIGVGEEDIAADIQAEVFAELKEDVDVRFADARSEAVLKDDEGAPVRDHGVLLAIGALPPDEETDVVDVDVEVYRSEADSSNVVLTIGRGSPDWTVTSTSVLSGDA